MLTLEDIYETIEDYTIEELVEIQKKCDDLMEIKREEIEVEAKTKIIEFLVQIQKEYNVSFIYECEVFNFNKFEVDKEF